MDKSLLDELYIKAQEIAKETADKLMQYHKSVAEIYYGSHPMSINAEEIEGDDQEKLKEITEKFNQYQEQAIAKAAYAPADKVKLADEMEKIIKEGNEKIKKLYDDALNDQDK
jgi:2-oxoglutarate dehydrogenase complex dehydrogenase (E1) component-like enzyme